MVKSSDNITGFPETVSGKMYELTFCRETVSMVVAVDMGGGPVVQLKVGGSSPALPHVKVF